MSNQKQFKKYSIGGVEVDACSIEQATQYIVEQAGSNTKACYVVKPYVEFLDRAYEDKNSAKLLNGAELCLADGVAVNWAALYLHGGKHSFWRWFTTLAQIVLTPKALYTVLPDRFSGVNATWPLLTACEAKGLSIFMVGSPKHNSIEYTIKTIKKRLPKLNVAGSEPGEMKGKKGIELSRALDSEHPEAELSERLKQLKPDIILIGMGFPLQEKIMATLSRQLDHGVLIGEGGTFDYQSFGGRQPKAPAFLQKIGLEWLWRMILEPSRIKRQIAIPRFMWRVYLEGKKTDST